MADTIYSLKRKKVWVAGETGLVGRAILQALDGKGCETLHAPHADLDLTCGGDTLDWLQTHRPDVIFMAAAKVGGIGANNDYPADFLHDNLAMAQNVIHGACKTGVEKLLFLGSSCIYPKNAHQPIEEESLLTGPLEPTNEPYAIAKIAGLKLCETYRRQYGCNFISAMPTNLYGPYDRFDAQTSHVIPAMIQKFHQAKEEGRSSVELWGSGTPLREFLYVDDLARGLIVMMEQYNGSGPINIGSGEEVSIRTLAGMIAGITDYRGDIRFDAGKPDGTPRKFLDSSKMAALGWTAQTPLADGLHRTYDWYLAHQPSPAG